MKILGLTGNIACGKSLVASLLESRRTVLLDADLLVRELYSRPEFSRQIATLFGGGVLNEQGVVDRGVLGRQVFEDARSMERLERLVHPAVASLRDEKAAALRALSTPPVAAVFEAVKLVESGQSATCDEVWRVRCGEETALRRMIKNRGLSRSQAMARLEAQPDLEEQTALLQNQMKEQGIPFFEIDNDGTKAELEARVEELWHRFACTV